VTGISQLSACSRFNSPALKNKGVKTFTSSKNDDSEILENLPSAMLSQISNEKKIMEEIKELQTRENNESNPIDKQKWSTPNYHGNNFGNVSSKDDNKFIKISDTNNILDKLKKPRQTAHIYGELLKWTKGPRLGFGIFGDVVKAINRENGGILAVKRLSIQRNEDEYNNEAIDALKAEINVLREVEHDNIIRYIGSEIVDKEFCIYIEYASEGSLLNLQKDFGPFDENLIRRFVKEILEGLKFLHSKNIAHQDLK
jgi:mitogen-activated protein kinase kinase kinase